MKNRIPEVESLPATNTFAALKEQVHSVFIFFQTDCAYIRAIYSLRNQSLRVGKQLRQIRQRKFLIFGGNLSFQI